MEQKKNNNLIDSFNATEDFFSNAQYIVLNHFIPAEVEQPMAV